MSVVYFWEGEYVLECPLSFLNVGKSYYRRFYCKSMNFTPSPQKQNKTKQNKTKQNKTKQNETKQNKAKKKKSCGFLRFRSATLDSIKDVIDFAQFGDRYIQVENNEIG